MQPSISAAVLHGVPRATFNLDILIEPTADNAKRLLDALLEANLGTAALTTTDELLAHEITIFQDRVRIDVQTKTPGIEFDDAWRDRIVVHYQDTVIYIVSKRDLISSKKASGRQVDLEDIHLLSEEDIPGQ